METLGWIVVSVIIIGGFILLMRWLMKPSREETEARAKHDQLTDKLYYRDFEFSHFPAEGVNGQTEEELIRTTRKTFRETKTKVLRVYLHQYGDLIRRIESDDPDTVNTLGAENKDFHWELAKANQQFVQDELRRRGENPF